MVLGGVHKSLLDTFTLDTIVCMHTYKVSFYQFSEAQRIVHKDGMQNADDDYKGEGLPHSFFNLTRVNLTGATATVSTLATVVGQPKTPMSAGNGGLRRGLPCFPSRLSISA